ncbi:MAG: type II secretion system F family protein [Phycisphaerae bacterium]|nr:type II secretion system F family protein [Phycisphaerae bacterium]
MARYKYEIQVDGGTIKSGVVNAASVMAASEIAQGFGGQVISVEPAGGEESLFARMQNIRVESRPGLKEVMYFTKQLAVMIKAGISIRDAIAGIQEQVTNMRFQKMLLQVQQGVEAGTPFSQALARHPKTFSTLYVNMVRASEMSGKFSTMLERIATYQEQQAETRSMIKGAMIYPAVLFTLSVSAVIFLLSWVMPRFLNIFKGKEHMLPKPTKMLLAASDFLRNDWMFLIGGFVALIVGLIFALRTDAGKLYFDKFKLKIPIMGRMFRAIYISRGLQTMGELVNAGVPMLETLDITADVSGNLLYRDLWLSVRDSVQEGDKIVTPLKKSTLFPGSVVQMISAGEESGQLGSVLTDISEFYARELKETIKAVTSLIEPIMIVLMGGVVGFIAMSIILPVFKMSTMAG